MKYSFTKIFLLCAIISCCTPSVSFAATSDFLYGLINKTPPSKSTRLILYIDTIIRPILEHEAQYKNGHLICYHAMASEGRLFMEVLRNLYEHITGKPLRSDFEFLRFWQDGSDYPDVDAFLRAYDYKIQDDLDPIRDVLVSANINLLVRTESTYRGGEDTWGFFEGNTNIIKTDEIRSGAKNYVERLLDDLFKKIGCNQSDISKLIAIKNDPRFKTKTGDIIQFIIPTKEVPRCAYISSTGGFFERTFGLDDIGPDNTFMFNEAQLMESQIRLFFAKAGPLLNPEFGVKMFRLSTLEPALLQEYKDLIKKELQKIFSQCSKLPKPDSPSLSPKPTYGASPLTEEEEKKIESILQWIRACAFPEFVKHEKPIPFLQKLLNEGTDINSHVHYNNTALGTAVEEEKMDVIEFLIAKGANVNEPGRGGYTPLHLATMHGRLPIIRFLVEHGANLNTKTPSKQTPLEIARNPLYFNAQIVAYLEQAERQQQSYYIRLKAALKQSRTSVAHYLRSIRSSVARGWRYIISWIGFK